MITTGHNLKRKTREISDKPAQIIQVKINVTSSSTQPSLQNNHVLYYKKEYVENLYLSN